ncbi:MAG TPA: NAD(P)/FAD-dependent oxidoreductase [Dongiaceae bacterium]|jgi:L-2-hydroxyglutarate oxidase LhgO
MTEEVECVVIGAGVIGLAVARALALAGREVVVLERHGLIGSEISSRNSEVIHAGIYYPTGSLKARHCVAGRELLYAYCAEHGVAHRRLGKLIVAATEAQLPALAALRAKAEANGVMDLQPLSAAEATALEPEVRVAGALLSASSGIVDSHGYMLSLQGEIEDHGGAIALNSPVAGGEIRDGGFLIHVGGDEPLTLECRLLVNAAGLGAQAIANSLQGLDRKFVPPLHLAKGHYFTLVGRTPFTHLVYPMPDAASLGVHVTLDLNGRAKFGPDVEWIDRIDYDVDAGRAASFYAAIRSYYPGLADGALEPGYSGIRPKLQAPGGPAEDFVIQGPEAHGLRGLVNLFGIESPGLTSSLAIADEARQRLTQRP